ncbi:MAG: FAD-binding oxidoreductase [Alphaproteobacteria bacterium]|nr:FAD-binding oxidoreductase [Alphaproteobacteria bacterium]
MTGTMATDVCIIGGGIAGCSAALHLAKRGISVVLLEKGRIGAQASGVNFGGVRRQGRHLAEIPLALRGRPMWDRMVDLVGEDCEFRATGHLRLARDPADMAALETYARDAGALGLDLELIGGNELRRRFPWLSEVPVGASWCPGDGQANPRVVGPAFGRAARAAGADLREGEEAATFERDGKGFRIATTSGLAITSRALVNTAGAWAGRVAGHFDEPVPIHSIAPQMVVTEPSPHVIGPVLGIVGGALYLRQIERGNVIFGGGDGLADIATTRSTVLPRNTVEVGALACRLIPHLARLNVIRVWTGIEGEMADVIPVIGPSRTTPGLFHAFGFSGHGFQLGPIVGVILAELIADGTTPSPIAPFDIGRFVG